MVLNITLIQNVIHGSRTGLSSIENSIALLLNIVVLSRLERINV